MWRVALGIVSAPIVTARSAIPAVAEVLFTYMVTYMVIHVLPTQTQNTFVSDIAIFVLKRDVKLQLTNAEYMFQRFRPK